MVSLPTSIGSDERAKILLVGASEVTREMLIARSHRVQSIDRASQAWTALKEREFDVVLLDIDQMGPGHADDGSRAPGLELCREIISGWPDSPVVVMTRRNEVETVVGAMRAGAYDFIAKPVGEDALSRTIQRALRHRIMRRRLKQLSEAVENIRHIEGVVGSSPGMLNLFTMIARVARSDAGVLITGESGTGKEKVARAIHDHSKRAERPFVAINCGAVPPNLLESELFGHVKGAFTSARSRRPGLFVYAEGGTLLLDEISEMPVEMQAKLLRVLQERVVRPVGGEEEIPFDVRIIAATNRDLAAAVDKGAFREDLYYRINVVHVGVPPLRARGNDVLRLAEHFTKESADRLGKRVPAISDQCARKLLQYDWPGNVRELENVIERAVALTRNEELTAEDLPRDVASCVASSPTYDGNRPMTLPSLADVERSYIHHVLEKTDGNKTRAAEVLGLDRRTLYRRLEKFELGHKRRASSEGVEARSA